MFISYKREEVAYAERVRRCLERSGYRVWWDRELQTGSVWAAEIDRQLAQASCVIVLWSRRASQSIWVRHEASAAMGRGTYLPAAIEELDVPDPFARVQAADLTGWDGRQDHPGFGALLRSLQIGLGDAAVQYDLSTTEVLDRWPSTVPRHIVVTIALWLRRNLASAIASFAIVALAFLVLATERAVKRLDHQVTTVNSAVGKLDDGISAVDTTGKSLTALMQQSRGDQGQMIDQLREQIAQTRHTSEDLSRVASLIDRSAKTGASLLDANLKRIDLFEVKLFVSIDPLAFVNAKGQPVLRKELAETVAASREDGDLPVEAFDPIVADLRSHYEEVRHALFRGWEFNLTLMRPAANGAPFPMLAMDDPGTASIRFQGEDGLTSFTISHVSGGERIVNGVQCWLVYRIPTNPAAGFRTYEDFRGAKLSFSLATQPSFELTTFRFHLGVGGERALFVQRDEMTHDEGGAAYAQLIVPKDYLARSDTPTTKR